MAAKIVQPGEFFGNPNIEVTAPTVKTVSGDEFFGGTNVIDKELDPEPKGFLSRYLNGVKDQFSSVGKSIISDYEFATGVNQVLDPSASPRQEGVNLIKEGHIARGLIRGVLGTVSQGASTIFSPITNAATSAIPGEGPLARAGQGAALGGAGGGSVGAAVGAAGGLALSGVEKLIGPLAESHPEVYKNINDALNVGLTLLGEKGATKAGAQRDIFHAPLTEVPGMAARNIGETALGVAKPIVKSAQAVNNLAQGLAKYGTSQATGLSPDTISQVLSNPEHFAPEEMAQFSRENIAKEALDVVQGRLDDLSETGKEYSTVRESRAPVVIPEGSFDQALSKHGIKLEDGVLKFDKESIPTSAGDRKALQDWYDTYAKDGVLTSNSLLNARKSLDQLAAWDSTKTDSANILAGDLRKTLNKVGRGQVDGLEELDKKFSSELNELNKVKRDYFNADGTIKDGAINKIANLTGKGKDKVLERLEQVAPGIREKIRTLKAVEDIEAASGQKAGTYARGAAVGFGAATMNVPVLIGAILTYPTIAVKILRGYAKALGVKDAIIERVAKDFEAGQSKSDPRYAPIDDTTSQPTKTLISEDAIDSNSMEPIIPYNDGNVNGANKPVKRLGGGGANLPQIYKGEKELTTKVLDRLKGKDLVSKQFIQDLSKGADLKQAERNLITKTLDEFGDTVYVKDFAGKVRSELLPLKRNKVPGNGRYESASLPAESRGQIASYSEHVYDSPIKTSAGDVHPGLGQSTNYFAHSRIEDLGYGEYGRAGKSYHEDMLDTAKDNYDFYRKKNDKAGMARELEDIKKHEAGIKAEAKQAEARTTRRVIEIQSDLFQKGRLESENPQARRAIGATYSSAEGKARVESEILARDAELAKLEPYRNTWHERIIREEVKQAAVDGKTKLQFPTGETAMKIEGLGDSTRWHWNDESAKRFGMELTQSELKVGREVVTDVGSDKWIITDVLGDGKFKAMPKDSMGEDQLRRLSQGDRIWAAHNNPLEESFDISGKVDSNNPIYKFYEKEVGRYLKNKYNAKLFTDPQGVNWFQLDVPKDAAKKPVEASKEDERNYA